MNLQSADCEMSKIREAITREFPSESYVGPVLEVSHVPSAYDAVEDNLDVVLGGKSWRELGSEYVKANHDDYVLMNDRSLPVFLGAWLWEAAKDVRPSNQVVASLVFHLAAFGGSEEGNTGLWGRGFRGLNQKQREVISLLLECAFANAEASQDREQIEQALRSIERNLSPK